MVYNDPFKMVYNDPFLVQKGSSRSLAVAEATSRNNNKLFFPGEYFENFNFLQKEKKRLSHFLFCKAFKAKKLKFD